METYLNFYAPFYEYITSIVPLTHLRLMTIKKPSSHNLLNRNIFQFSMVSDINTWLSESKKQKSPKFDIRVIMSFSKSINTNKTACKYRLEHKFPRHLQVHVNNKAISLPKDLPYDRFRKDGRRFSRPVDITDAICDYNNTSHKCVIRWMQESRDEKFHFVIHLVRRRNCEELTAALMNHKIREIQETVDLIAIVEGDNLNSKNESKCVSDIDGSLITSLICPVSFIRMAIPVRGKDCRHLQCFDCVTYLVMNFHKPMWRCPICDRRALFLCLEVDRLILNVINDDRSISLTKIAFNKSGQWRSAMDEEYDDGVSHGAYEGDIVPMMEGSDDDVDVNANVKSATKKQKTESQLPNILTKSDWPSLINQFCPAGMANRDIPSDSGVIECTPVQYRPPQSKASAAVHPNNGQILAIHAADESVFEESMASDPPMEKSAVELMSQSKPEINSSTSIDYDTNGTKMDVTTKSRVLSRKFTSRADLAIKEKSELNISHFDDVTLIPNALKLNQSDRRMVLVGISSMEPYRLSELTGPLSADDGEKIEIYMIRGSCHLITCVDNDRMLTVMKPSTSYKFQGTASSLSRSVLKPIETPSKFIIEVVKVAENVYKTELASKNSEPLTHIVTFTATNDHLKKKDSFLKSFYSLSGMRSLMVFIYTEWVISSDFEEMEEGLIVESKYQPVPISVTILDYGGQCLLNSMITPRKTVVNYETRFHGHSEAHVIGQMDHYCCLNKVHDIVRGKVLVGHNLQLHMRLLKIDLNHIMGIRDVSNAKCYAAQFYRSGHCPNLTTLSRDLLDVNLEQGTLTSSEVASIIRRIYLKYETDWKDTVGARANEMFSKEKIYKRKHDNSKVPLQPRKIGEPIPVNKPSPESPVKMPATDVSENTVVKSQIFHIDEELGPEPEISLEEDSFECDVAEEPKSRIVDSEADSNLPISNSPKTPPLPPQ